MPAVLMITTCRDWISNLAEQSRAIAALELEKDIRPEAQLNDIALDLANCSAHNRLITQAVEGLLGDPIGASIDFVRGLVGRLIYRGTEGAFAELVAYDWLSRCYVRYVPNVELTREDVLGAKGSTLDGKIEFGPYFDVKAFGFNNNAASQLRVKLQEQFPDEQVLITGSWDIGLTEFGRLIESAARLADQLRSKRYVKSGPLEIRLQPKQAVTVSMRLVSPYRLARENAEHIFRGAQQFARRAPFALLYVMHPWLSGGVSYVDFACQDTILTRSLARRAFIQFSTDTRPLSQICDRVAGDLTVADASRLLSAIFFVNIWPESADSTPARKAPTWIYLNPRATYPMSAGSLGRYRGQNVNGTNIDDFADDDY